MFQYDDPLDAEDFDPVQFINSRFPTEASLDELDTFAVSVDSKINAIEEALSKAVQNQSRIGHQASKDIASAQASILELFQRLNEIKSQASHSERMVQEICADIRKLDCAKNHLQGSITALKRLQMLITAIDQLELLLKDLQYKDMAHLLEAARQLMTFFDKYCGIPQVAALKTRLDAIQTTLKRHVHHTFLEIGQLVETVADGEVMIRDLPGNMKTLADASLLVDALGLEMRRDVLDEFVIAQLNPYKRLFGPNMTYHAIEHTERRWAWFKRLLKSVEAKFASIWPAHWEVPRRLCVAFLELTREHTVSMLIENASEEQQDVSVLLKALQTTLRFEQEMDTRFAMDPRMKQPPRPIATAFLQDDEETAEEAHQKAAAMQESYKIRDVISDEYDQFLAPYVTLERSNLDEMLETLKAEEDTIAQSSVEDEYAPATGGGITGVSSKANVYDSSIQMFVFIKNSIKRCTTLTTGNTFLALSHEFRLSLKKYSETLRAKSLAATRVAGGELSIAYLINTAEYCADVIPRLEAMVKTKIKEPLADKVDFSPEVDLYLDLVVDLLKTLTGVVMDRLEPGFKAAASINWASLTQVGEENAYLLQLLTTLTDLLPRIQSILSSDVYFNNLCAKLANELLHRYLDLIMRQRSLSEVATQQWLLDTCSLRSLIMSLPKLRGIGEGVASASYVKVVTSRVNQIEAVLKLLATPPAALCERFVAAMPEGTVADLFAIMTTKGIKKAEQQPLIDAYQALHPDELKTPSSAPTTTDNFPLLVSLGGTQTNADSRSAISMAASMRNLTTDLSFSVGNLKWSK